MTLTDVVILVIVLGCILAAACYIRKVKKRGGCVGCSCSKECAAKKAGKNGCCGNHTE